MIHQTKATVVIMLTNVVESGEVCDKVKKPANYGIWLIYSYSLNLEVRGEANCKVLKATAQQHFLHPLLKDFKNSTKTIQVATMLFFNTSHNSFKNTVGLISKRLLLRFS